MCSEFSFSLGMYLYFSTQLPASALRLLIVLPLRRIEAPLI